MAGDLQGLDLSQGIAMAVPGWEDVRLLAPHAELRLLVCGQPSLIDAHRLRCAPMCKCISQDMDYNMVEIGLQWGMIL